MHGMLTRTLLTRVRRACGDGQGVPAESCLDTFATDRPVRLIIGDVVATNSRFSRRDAEGAIPRGRKLSVPRATVDSSTIALTGLAAIVPIDKLTITDLA